jgi:ferredoxin/flavodoxin---NADP+ reductase
LKGSVVFKIVEKQELTAGVHRYVVQAADVAIKAKAGQFVILRLNEHGERIPITIADSDSERGTLTLFVQAVGKTSIEMSRLQTGDSILDLVGPLGLATEIEKFGTVVLVGGGFGIAAMHPIARELIRAGNKTISILGARSRDLLLLLEEMQRVSNEVRVATNDGSLGTKGLVTDILSDMIQKGEPIDRVIAIGPLVMMKAVAEITRPVKIKTLVSLNPIMIDGTGMCGACRVTVGSEMKFACVDGPEFDGHLVDFDGLINRLKTYLPEEQKSRDELTHEPDEECRLEEAIKSPGNQPI